MQLLRLFLVVCVGGCSVLGLVDWSSETMKEIRREVIPFWRNRNPINRRGCGKEVHQNIPDTDAQRLSDAESTEILTTLHNLMLKADNRPLIGLNETLIGLRAKAVDVIIFGNSRHISVFDYRNPITGRHIYEFCNGWDCDSRNEISDGTDYKTFFLWKCMTLQKFIRKFYRSGPAVVIVSHSSDFFRSVGELAAFSKPGFLLADGKAFKPSQGYPPNEKYLAYKAF